MYGSNRKHSGKELYFSSVQFAGICQFSTISIICTPWMKNYLLFISEKNTSSTRGIDTRKNKTQVCTRFVANELLEIVPLLIPILISFYSFAGKQENRSKVWFSQLIKLKGRQEVRKWFLLPCKSWRMIEKCTKFLLHLILHYCLYHGIRFKRYSCGSSDKGSFTI